MLDYGDDPGKLVSMLYGVAALLPTELCAIRNLSVLPAQHIRAYAGVCTQLREASCTRCCTVGVTCWARAARQTAHSVSKSRYMSTEARFEQKRVRAPSAGRTENELAESSVKTEVMKGHSVVTRLQVMLTALIKGIKKGGKEKERAEGRQ